MKKIISVILSITVLSSVFCMNVSAAEEESYKYKLGLLIDGCNGFFSQWGNPIVYYLSSDVLVAVTDVYQDPKSTELDYKNALEDLKNDLMYSPCVFKDYAESVYDLAIKEQNYNNWYSEDEWTDFQNKLSRLKTVLDQYGSSTDSEVTLALNSMLGAYNKMTNAYTLKGDINGDGAVNVADATLLQKYLVGTENLTGAQKMLANAENYENPSVIEATLIQKYAAGQINELPNYGHFLVDEGLDFIDEDIVYERTLNFNICPRKYMNTIDNEFKHQTYELIFDYYSWCNENGYAP